MTGFFSYALGALGICALTALAGFISYRGNADGAAKGALAVILLFSLVSAFSSIDFDFSFDISGEQFLPEGGGEYERVGREALEAGIRRLIADRYSLPEENISVRAEGYDFSAMRAERIFVLLSGRAVYADARAIKNYISEQGLGECEVDIEI